MTADYSPHVILFPKGNDGELEDGFMGVFGNAQEAIDHATEHVAGWQSWVVGRVEVVHTYTSPDDEEDARKRAEGSGGA